MENRIRQNPCTTFYAHVLRFIERDVYDQRCAVYFEAVPKSSVSMFLSGTLQAEDMNKIHESEYFERSWAGFSRGGLTDKDFLKNKSICLAEAGIAQLVLYFNSFVHAKSISEGKTGWWEIEIGSKLEEGCRGDSSIVRFVGEAFHADEYSFQIKALTKEEENILDSLYRCQEDLLEMSVPDMNLGIVKNETIFKQVEVLHLGAALGCILYEASGAVAGFFDMGEQTPKEDKKLHKQTDVMSGIQCCKIASNIDNLKRVAQSGTGLMVIISHWHLDHVNVLIQIADDYVKNKGGQYKNFWETSCFVIPSVEEIKIWPKLHFNSFKAALDIAMQQGNTPSLYLCPYKNTNEKKEIISYKNIRVYKIDRDDTRISIPHPHDHGIFATVNLFDRV